MADSSEEKELPATAKRLSEAIRQGNIPRSRDLSHALVLGSGALLFSALGPAWWGHMRTIVTEGMRFDEQARRDGFPFLDRLFPLLFEASWPVITVLLVAVLAGTLAATVPGGMHWSSGVMKFNLGKFNPLSYFKRIFSLRSTMDFLKLVLIAAVVAIVATVYVGSHINVFAGLAESPLRRAVATAATLVGEAFGWMLLVVFLVALLDVPFQWWRHQRELRMSRTEVKEEGRQAEGSPETKGRQRARQREMHRNRMLAEVARADVVLTNPTHYAVALRYDQERMGAPMLVAKGSDMLAQRIQALARESNVPILNMPPLARTLYHHVRLQTEIPPPLYGAIAAILGYLWHLRQWVPGRERPPQPPQQVDIPPDLQVGPDPEPRPEMA